MVLACGAPILILLAEGPRSVLASLLMVSFFVYGVGLGVSSVHAVTQRQAVTPASLSVG